MKQDINLLTNASGRRSPLPSAMQVGVVLLLAVFTSACAGFWLEFRHDGLEKTARTLNTGIDDLIFNLEERSHFLAERDVNPSVLSELKRLEGEADDKSRVLNLLSGKAVGNTDGFSEYLAALGRRHPDGLWLDRIRIGDGGRHLTLRGMTLDADLVPQFVRALQHEPALAGTGFARFSLAGDKAGQEPMRFVLSTGCGSETDAEGGEPCPSIAAGKLVTGEPES